MQNLGPGGPTWITKGDLKYTPNINLDLHIQKIINFVLFKIAILMDF